MAAAGAMQQSLLAGDLQGSTDQMDVRISPADVKLAADHISKAVGSRIGPDQVKKILGSAAAAVASRAAGGLLTAGDIQQMYGGASEAGLAGAAATAQDIGLGSKVMSNLASKSLMGASSPQQIQQAFRTGDVKKLAQTMNLPRLAMASAVYASGAGLPALAAGYAAKNLLPDLTLAAITDSGFLGALKGAVGDMAMQEALAGLGKRLATNTAAAGLAGLGSAGTADDAPESNGGALQKLKTAARRGEVGTPDDPVAPEFSDGSSLGDLTTPEVPAGLEGAAPDTAGSAVNPSTQLPTEDEALSGVPEISRIPDTGVGLPDSGGAIDGGGAGASEAGSDEAPTAGGDVPSTEASQQSELDKERNAARAAQQEAAGDAKAEDGDAHGDGSTEDEGGAAQQAASVGMEQTTKMLLERALITPWLPLSLIYINIHVLGFYGKSFFPVQFAKPSSEQWLEIWIILFAELLIAFLVAGIVAILAQLGEVIFAGGLFDRFKAVWSFIGNDSGLFKTLYDIIKG